MNASDFKTSFENRTELLEFLSTGVCPSCTECQRAFAGSEESLRALQDDGIISDEGSFSWSACDTCGSTWGGNRYDAHARADDGTLIHLDVCGDCLFFINFGDEPEDWTQHSN